MDAGNDITEGKLRRFASNGMSVCLERARLDVDTGLFEVATPECEGPESLVLRLRATDTLLTQALPTAQRLLAADGVPGKLGLLKNSRDADGEFYGRQENAEVRFSRGAWSILWWLGLTVLIPLLAISFALVFVRVLVGVVRLAVDTEPDLTDLEMDPRFVQVVFDASGPHFVTLGFVLALVERVGFRRQRGALEGFLLSRPVITGAGWLDDEGRMHLSGKAAGITRWWSRDLRPWHGEHAVFSTGNLAKHFLKPNGWTAAYRQTQRLQIGLADSNRCEAAEVLGTTTFARVIELAEKGALRDAPRFTDPVGALHALNTPDLSTTVVDTSGRTWTALELQGFYQQRCATEWPEDELVHLWGEVITGLTSEPNRWIGRIDWVTKRWLLEQCADDAPFPVRKRIDIGYHELGEEDLWSRIQDALPDTPLLDPDAVRTAMLEAPDGPARHRAELILAHGGALDAVDWGSVRLNDQVIFLRR